MNFALTLPVHPLTTRRTSRSLHLTAGSPAEREVRHAVVRMSGTYVSMKFNALREKQSPPLPKTSRRTDQVDLPIGACEPVAVLLDPLAERHPRVADPRPDPVVHERCRKRHVSQRDIREITHGVVVRRRIPAWTMTSPASDSISAPSPVS